MNRKWIIRKSIFLFFIAYLLTSQSASPQSSKIELNHEPRQKLLFDDNWKFHLGDVSGADKVDFNDKNWRNLSLPHDWSIEGASIKMPW
jgi:hypothetical protein